MATTAHAADAAVAAAEHGEKAGMPQLDFSTYASQIFWLAVALFILYRALSRSVLPKIAQTLEERHNAIAGDLDKAAELRRQAEASSEAYDAALADARSKAEGIAAAEKAEVTAKIDEAVAKADAEIAARLSESDTEIDGIRASAKESVRNVAADAAEAMLQRLLPGAADGDAVRSAVSAKLNA